MARCKYEMLQKQIFDYDLDKWVETFEYKIGGLLEKDSRDCDPLYRWVDSSSVNDYICIGYNKYIAAHKQVSYDRGKTWQEVLPIETQAGSRLLEFNSRDCGYIVDEYRWVETDETICGDCSTNNNFRVRCYTSDGGYFDTPCQEGNNDITSANTFTWVISCRKLVLGDCVKKFTTINLKITFSEIDLGKIEEILPYSFYNTSSSYKGYASNYIIPSTVKKIGKNSFYYLITKTISFTINEGLEEIEDDCFNQITYVKDYLVLPSTIRKIGSKCFYRVGTTAFVILSKTPPVLTNPTECFYNPYSEQTIYVPDESLDLYRHSSTWSQYGDKIMPISSIK